MASIRNIDVHLLTTLDHLLRERSVTITSQRMGVTQPAVSAALAKLRRHFNDELLVRQHGTYVLTPLAAQLAERIPKTLAEVLGLLETGQAFDPSTTTRQFTLICSDQFTTLFGNRLTRELQSQAPASSVRFLPIGYAAEALETRLLETDGLVLPRGSIPDLPSVDIATDDWVLVVARERAAQDGPIDRSMMERCGWVTFRAPHGGHVPPVEYLQSQGLELRFEIVVGDFVSIPALVADSDRIGIVPRRLAEVLAPAAGAAIRESSIPLPALITTLLWHPAKEFDPSHIWLRNAVGALAGPR